MSLVHARAAREVVRTEGMSLSSEAIDLLDREVGEVIKRAAEIARGDGVVTVKAGHIRRATNAIK